MSWQGSDDSSGIRGYQVQYRQVGDPAWSTLIAHTSATSVLFTKGDVDERYEFQVQATDNVNNSAWSAVAEVLLTAPLHLQSPAHCHAPGR